MRIRSKAVWGLGLLFALTAPLPALAQATGPGATSDPDSRIDVLQPDFTLVSLPTTLRLPSHKMAFRVTHRFNRPLGRGDFGDLLNDFFGFDSGAQIGLEFRYGLRPGTQVGINRTSDRTIELFGQQNLWQQKPDGAPLGLDVRVSFEGANNLRDQKTGTVGVLVSRKIGRIAAVYAEPMFLANSSPLDTGDSNTAMIGLGGRIRIRPATYIVAEVSPRLGGYSPGVPQGSFGLEMRAGGHTFQINFSNGVGTTLGQIARDGVSGDSWFIGFNISRKFF